MSTAERSTPPHAPGSRDVDSTRYVPDDLVEGFVIVDPDLVRSLKAEREASGFDRRDEVWDGIYVMSPDPNNEHQFLAAELILIFGTVRGELGGGRIYACGNISDRIEGWNKNYRIPDVAVYLSGNPARNCGTHTVGGPDFAVEILSEGDLARSKLDFYAKVNTRELLIIDRDSWALELYRLIGGHLELVGVSTPENFEIVSSQVLPLTFRLVPGEERPTIEVCRLDGRETWRI
jgi:Uma2 family endonuclease